MKLSEMSTEKLADTLLEIAEPVSNIACDEAITNSMQMLNMKKSNIYNIGLIVNQMLPLLLKTHADDTYRIIAALTEKTVEQVKVQNGLKTIEEVRGSFDKNLIDFFGSFTSTAQKK